MEEKNFETKIQSATIDKEIKDTNVKETTESTNKNDNKLNNKDSQKQEKEQDTTENVKDEETRIKEAVQNKLKQKIKDSGFWTEEQLSRAKNVEENETRVASDYVLDMAEKRIANEDPKSAQTKNQNYYKKLEKKCMDIAENEAQVNPNFDIEAAIKKEEEIQKKLENGEITPEEALEEYAKPIPELNGGMMSSLEKYGVKTYEDIYKEMAEKEKTAEKSNSFRESLTKGAPSLKEQAENSKKFQEKIASNEDRHLSQNTEITK